MTFCYCLLKCMNAWLENLTFFFTCVMSENHHDDVAGPFALRVCVTLIAITVNL